MSDAWGVMSESVLLLLPSAIPEMQVGIHPRRHSRNLLSGIQVFAFSLVFKYLWTPAWRLPGWRKRGNRTIQGWRTWETTITL